MFSRSAHCRPAHRYRLRSADGDARRHLALPLSFRRVPSGGARRCRPVSSAASTSVSRSRKGWGWTCNNSAAFRAGGTVSSRVYFSRPSRYWHGTGWPLRPPLPRGAGMTTRAHGRSPSRARGNRRDPRLGMVGASAERRLCRRTARKLDSHDPAPAKSGGRSLGRGETARRRAAVPRVLSSASAT